MSLPRIALLFEFATLNGGERSMLAALDCLRLNPPIFEFVAIGPPSGRLAEAIRQRQIPLIGWSIFDEHGVRLPAEQIQGSLRSIVDRLRPQLLHANSLSMGRLVGRCLAHAEILTSAHLRDIIKLSGAAISDLNRNQRLIAVSDATRAFHVAQGIDDQRVTVVRNGINLEQFHPQKKSGRLLAELKIPFDQQSESRHTIGLDALAETSSTRPILIATIGQIGLRKGQDVLAAAAPAVIAQFPNAHFLLIGERTSQKDESIAFERAIIQSFAAAGLTDRLHFLGHRDDVSNLLNEIDVLVHPAQQEPFGRVLLEASASGVPIVATNVGGTPEIILDGITGLLVPARSAEALAGSLIKILANPSFAKELGSAARTRAMKEFSIATATANLVQVWNRLLSTNQQ